MRWLAIICLSVALTGHVNAEDTHPLKSSLQENMTGYQSRYSLSRRHTNMDAGSKDKELGKSKRMIDPTGPIHPAYFNIVHPEYALLAKVLNARAAASRMNEMNQVDDDIVVNGAGLRVGQSLEEEMEDDDVKREQFTDNFKDFQFEKTVMMMAKRQEDVAISDKLGDDDYSYNLQAHQNVDKFKAVMMMAKRQEDVAISDKLDDDVYSYNLQAHQNVDKFKAVMMMAKRQEDVAISDKLDDDDYSYNLQALQNVDKFQAVMMMAKRQEDVAMSDNNDKIQETDDTYNSYQAVMMMAVQQANLLPKRDHAEQGAPGDDAKRIVRNMPDNTVMMMAKFENANILVKRELENTKWPKNGVESTTNQDVLSRIGQVRRMRQNISTDITLYFSQWEDFLHTLSDCSVDEFEEDRTKAIAVMGLSEFFLNIFWPFRYDVNVMNQRLAVYGFEMGESSDRGEQLKTRFFKGVEQMLGIRFPVEENEVILSFNDDAIVKELLRTGILNVSESFAKAEKYMFTEIEKAQILNTANAALRLINETSPDLYRSIIQMISVIGFYRAEDEEFTGGTGPSLIGMIWLNPMDLDRWSVPFMAEQIVHEFTHNSLFSAELVHGMYRKGSDLSTAQPLSSIRREHRDYDRCLHAAYVSASLITFHTRIGQFERANQLAETLVEAVHDLNAVNDKANVLDKSGRAVLQFLNDYVCLMNLN